MKYEWDPRKAASNLDKHKVDFADAVIALEDEQALTIEDRDHDEQRFITLGMGPYVDILYVVYGYKEHDTIRIISARKANKQEIKLYYRGL